VTIAGQTFFMSELTAALGINRNVLANRLMSGATRGMTPLQALTEPKRHRGNTHGSKGRQIEFRGQAHSMAEWARRLGASAQTVRSRLAKGWSVERALIEPPKKKPHD
jgi:hypothetical protein